MKNLIIILISSLLASCSFAASPSFQQVSNIVDSATAGLVATNDPRYLAAITNIYYGGNDTGSNDLTYIKANAITNTQPIIQDVFGGDAIDLQNRGLRDSLGWNETLNWDSRTLKGGDWSAPTNNFTAKTFADQTGPIPSAIYIPSGTLNVKAMGAAGDGVTDDTAVIQQALDFGPTYIPAGTYLVSNLVCSSSTKMVRGEGLASVLLFNSAVTNWLLTATNGTILKDFRLTGGVTNTFEAVTTNGARNGLIVNCSAPFTSVSGVFIDGFNGSGLGMFGTNTMHDNSPDITMSKISYCFKGLTTVVDGKPGEYSRLIGNSISYCRTGLEIGSGNTLVSANNINNNYTGISITANGNEGHGSIVGNTINHSSGYFLYALNIGVPMVISGNQMFFGNGYIQGCSGFNIYGNLINSTNINFSGGFTNLVHDNYFYSQDMKLTKNVDRSFLAWNNFYTSGKIDGNNNVAFGLFTNLVVANTITVTNGITYPPKSSGPTWAQVGASNTIVEWSSNSIPPAKWSSYFDAGSNRTDKLIYVFP